MTCSSDYSGTCNSDTWTYWCPNDWFYSESSEVREVVCCTDEDCQNDHGGNKNYKCENNRTECNCYPTDAGCGSGYCKNIKNACWNGCNWENGTKDCCTPNPELCKNNEELKEAAAKTCIGALSIDECGGYTCEGTMNCKGWKEQSKKSTK